MHHVQQPYFILEIISKLVFVLALLLCASSAYAATLSLNPSTGVYTAGSTFTARVVVNTNGDTINAADGTLSFNPKEITVVSVSKGSIFNLWTAEPSFSNGNGTITFSGGSPTGYKGNGGTVISITFKANAAGSPRVSFSSGSVLAADGRGTNVLTNMNGGSFTIAAAGATPEPEEIEYVAPANTPAAPKITSATHPDSSTWYTVKKAELSWDLPSGITGVRTLLDTSPSSVPNKVYDEPMRSIILSDLEEGVSYFHMQFRNADGWGKVSHYRLAVDTQKPSKFDISLIENADLSNPTQTLRFTTEDATSKVKRFLIQLDGAQPYEFIDVHGSSTHTLPALLPGYHTAIVEAFDEAGNSIISTFSFTILAFDKPQFTEYPSEINEEVIPVIKGITRPNAKVKVTLAKVGASPQEYELQSSENGEFIFIPEGRLSQGVYELTAVAIDQYGAQSDVSNAIKIAVQEPGFIRLGGFIVSVLSVIVPLLALTVLLFVGTWFLLFRLRLLKRGVNKETKEALAMLSSEFGTLQAELVRQKEMLESTRKTKKLTKGETELIETLGAALANAKNKVEKEIGDVEDLVD